jgi:hypothetical protein
MGFISQIVKFLEYNLHIYSIHLYYTAIFRETAFF